MKAQVLVEFEKVSKLSEEMVTRVVQHVVGINSN
jgi:hypothetical protein